MNLINRITKKGGYWLVLLFLIVSIAFAIFNRRNSELALKSSTIKEGLVIDKAYGRGPTRIYVRYQFNGRNMESNFTSEIDSFNIGDKLLLEISKEDPDKYIRFLKKID